MLRFFYRCDEGGGQLFFRDENDISAVRWNCFFVDTLREVVKENHRHLYGSFHTVDRHVAVVFVHALL